MNELLELLSEHSAFEDFSMFCFSRNGTYFESHSQLVDRRLESNTQELLIAYEASIAQKREASSWTSEMRTHKIDRMTQWELWAMRASLENCMANKRRTYQQTFVSSLLFPKELCTQILQDIENFRITSNNLQVSPSNPLIWILGYDTLPEQKWSSILKHHSMPSGLYVHGELMKVSISECEIDIDAYHPFIWIMLQAKKHYHLQKFLRNFKAQESFLKFCQQWLRKAQEKRATYNLKINK